MKISVITVNLNNAAGLAKTLESVRTQVTTPFEYIVVDGGSADGSIDIIKSSTLITSFISERDGGIYDAMNKGIDRCTGDYIYFLNSGDRFYDPDVLKKISGSGSDADLIYGNTILDNREKKRLVPPASLDIPFFMTGMLWHPCVFTARRVFAKCGRFNPDLKIAGDYEFLIRALFRYDCSYAYLDVDINLFDVSGTSNDPLNSALESSERKKSWQLNFSESQIKTFEDHTRLLRSSEYKWGSLFKKWLRPFTK